jgi:hypothetical protein
VVVSTSKTVILGIAVEEHAELEQWIGTVFDSWDHGAGREGSLINVTMIVLWVLVDSKFAELV